MHEMGVVIQIVKTANEFALRNGVKEVNKLTLEIGEASSIMPKYVYSFFSDVITDYPILSNCKLEIETAACKAFCLDCGEVFHPGDREKKESNCAKPRRIREEKLTPPRCPKCGSDSFKIFEGNSMIIKSMEVL